MKQNCEIKMKVDKVKYNWETDYEFYLDQKGPRIQTLGAADVKLYRKEQEREELQAKRSKYYEKQISAASEEGYVMMFIIYF